MPFVVSAADSADRAWPKPIEISQKEDSNHLNHFYAIYTIYLGIIN